MEQNKNNPEKKNKGPLTDNCNNCQIDYELTPENTTLYHYSSQDELDNLLCHCPNCSYETRIFIGSSTFERAVNNGIDLSVEKNAPDDVYSDWISLKGIELPKTYELTNRHRAIVRRFGEVILAMPDDMLYDGFHDPTEKPYPLRWID